MKSPSMNHADIQLLLADYSDLRGAEGREVDSHVATCGACAARLSEYQAMDVALQGLPDARPGPALRAGYYVGIRGGHIVTRCRPAAVRRTWIFGFASVAALLLVVVATWMLLQPGGGGNVSRPRGSGAVPAANSAEVGSFIWQTDGVYGYEVLRPAGWVVSDLAAVRSYSRPITDTNDSTLELLATNLDARGYANGPEAFYDLKVRFDATPNLADWATSAGELWTQSGLPISRIAEVPNAVIFQMQNDPPSGAPTSRVASTLIGLAVREGQPFVLALNVGGQYGRLEALQTAGIWDDFLAMINSLNPIAHDPNNVEPWAPTATPTAETSLPDVTPAPTALTVFTPDLRPSIGPSWQLIEQELSRKALGALVANRVCDWTVLGRNGASTYVWAYCTAYQGAPEVTAASLPAVLTVTDVTGITVQTPRDGSYYPEDVRDLFPPNVQQMIFDRTFDPILPQLERHAKLRLKWEGLPPMGAAETVPADANAPAASGATISIFSGRPDPAWGLTVRELVELDRLISALAQGQCPPLPDKLDYRGVRVGLGMEPAGKLIAAEGFVQSGDAGLNADALCLSDTDRAVERFLLSSAQANVSDAGLKELISGLLQPVPTPLVTPSSTPTAGPQ